MTKLLQGAQNAEDFSASLSVFMQEIQGRIQTAEQRQADSPFVAFAGETRLPPAYAGWLMSQFGATPLLHLRETKRPIGRDEAQALLNLKIKRGGPERLTVIQDIVEGLLGVKVDAFAAEGASGERPERSPEMDVDDFLVEANGAGVREALRLILDLELRAPELALIEEPEVHLHPGLERSLEGYLRTKSRAIQIFVATHSTHFVDASTFQNVFLISKDATKRTVCTAVSGQDEAFRIPAELGLKLSSVFMFDQLVFVEGPSDEAVLRECAAILGCDLAQMGTGFVQMGGVRNYAHYATEHTVSILSRRQIRMSFVVDRDEANDEEVKAMVAVLGARAQLKVLNRRELENYLLVPRAIALLLGEKLGAKAPSEVEVAKSVEEEIQKLKEEVVRLRVERRLLRPIVFQSRKLTGDARSRLEAGAKSIGERLGRLEEIQREEVESVDRRWSAEGRDMAPGSKVLEAVFRKFGSTFHKDAGDSVRLARALTREEVTMEIVELVTALARPVAN